MMTRARAMVRAAGVAVAIIAVAARAGGESPPGAIAAGGRAPALDGPGVVVVNAGDDATSRPLLLVFAKPDDVHTKDAMEAIAELHARHPHTREGSGAVLVWSRLGDGAPPITIQAPAHWRVLRDGNDVLYAAYHIIATPTVVIVDAQGTIVGVHAGYNSGLAQAVRRDLLVAIDGPDSVNAPTPTPGIMDVQMGRALARRRLWERALEYYARARADQPLPCDIALEEVDIRLELRQPEQAVALLDSLKDPAPCAARVTALRERARAIAAGEPAPAAKPPSVP